MSNNTIGIAGTVMKSILPRFLLRKKQAFHRRHERQSCVLIGAMEISENGAKYEGAVLEISAGGCSFRPARLFLLDGFGLVVILETDSFRMEGKIRAVRPASYGIQFYKELSDACLDQIIAEHGGRIEDSFLANAN